MKISIAWMATTLRELELLSPLLVSQSTLTTSARPLHWAAAWEIFHLITGLFLIRTFSHWFCLIFSSIFITNFAAQIYGILNPYSFIKTAVILNTLLAGGMVVQILSSQHGGLGSIPRSSQHGTQYFHSFTTLLASILGSALSTQAPVSPCWAFQCLALPWVLIFAYSISVSHNSISLVQQPLPGKCISAILQHNPIIQSCIHQIPTHIHSTVSTNSPPWKRSLAVPKRLGCANHYATIIHAIAIIQRII